MKYQCLVLDHDDTVVDSTASIHYPAFLEALKIMRPGETISLEDYFRENFSPGFIEFCTQRYQMTQQDFDMEVEIWKNYVTNHIPKAYAGIRELIERQKAEGGYVCVVSHSYDFNIRRDYKENNLPEPDIIFGWEYPPEQRKPSPYALKEICRRFGLEPSQLLMVDDLKPGYDMAKSFGVPFAGAGWANEIPEIRSFMEEKSDFYFTKVEELYQFLFDDKRIR